jgi:hypothetical protein
MSKKRIMEPWFFYLVTVEPGPKMPGEEVRYYLDASRIKLPRREINIAGDTVFRKYIGYVMASDVDDAFIKAKVYGLCVDYAPEISKSVWLPEGRT